MAGHSKWANIQHRKGAQDARRGKLFTKLIREITVSARAGGGEASNNPRLRAAMDKALTANMSKDTIERAIKKEPVRWMGTISKRFATRVMAPAGLPLWWIA